MFRRSHALGLAPAPITPLYNYFGADLTLYMAFLRLYSLWLWLPAVLGLVLFVFQETEYAGRESVFQAIYALLVVLWATLFLQQWTRKKAQLTHQWATPAPTEETAAPERLEFRAPGPPKAFSRRRAAPTRAGIPGGDGRPTCKS